MPLKSFVVAVMLIGSTAATTQAQGTHAGHSADMAHGPTAAAPDFANSMSLTEPGQGAFAALSEVVCLLEQDPDTDWSQVDLAALHSHLMDMDLLITQTEVAETLLPNGLLAKATGTAQTQAALRRMVPAHAAQLARDTRWKVQAQATEGHVTLQVTSDDPDTIARIQGLGFFGLMASQDHHRAHHLMIARGDPAHNP